MKKENLSHKIVYSLKKLLINLLIVFLAGMTFWGTSSIYNNFLKELPKNTKPNSLNDLLNMTITDFEKHTGSRPQVEILNGCGVAGIALDYTKFLRKSGFDVTNYKNANHFNYDSTQIILINGQIEQAHELAELMDINLSQVHTESLEKIENLILVIGKDYEKLNSFFKIEWTTP